MDAPERIFRADWIGNHYAEHINIWSGPSTEYIRADLAPDAALLAEAVEKFAALEKAASEVARRGAETGPQWTKLTIALLSARAVLAAVFVAAALRHTGTMTREEEETHESF